MALEETAKRILDYFKCGKKKDKFDKDIYRNKELGKAIGEGRLRTKVEPDKKKQAQHPRRAKYKKIDPDE